MNNEMIMNAPKSETVKRAADLLGRASFMFEVYAKLLQTNECVAVRVRAFEQMKKDVVELVQFFDQNENDF